LTDSALPMSSATSSPVEPLERKHKKSFKGGGCWNRKLAEVHPEEEARRKAEEARREQMQDMFASYDTDGNGTMDAAELKALLSAIGLPLDEVQLAGVMEEMKFRADIEEDELVDIDDENEEEKISLDFEGFMKVVGTQNSAQDLELKEIWPLFDTDGDGKLSQEELQQALLQCGIIIEQDDFDKLWLKADVDQNGDITFDEFTEASGEETWRKAIAMLSIKQELGGRCLKIAESQKQWGDLLAEREEEDYIVDRAQVLRRCAIRESAEVHEAIWQMWTVFDGLRTQAHDLVGKKLFMTYFLKVGKVVLGEDDFDVDDMTEMAHEEYDRQLARCAEKQASNGEEVVAHDCEDGGLDFDIFYESMFELIDYEVSREGHHHIAVSSYTAKVTAILNQLVEEKISNGTKKWQKGQPVSALEKLGRNWTWLYPDDLNFTGVTGKWESIDRRKEAIILAELKADEKSAANKKAAKLRVKAPPCAKITTGGGDPRKLFRRILKNFDEDNNGLLDEDELAQYLSDEGFTGDVIHELIMHMDADSDGIVTETEFIDGYKLWCELVKSQAVKELNKTKNVAAIKMSQPTPTQSETPFKPPDKQKKARPKETGVVKIGF